MSPQAPQRRLKKIPKKVPKKVQRKIPQIIIFLILPLTLLTLSFCQEKKATSLPPQESLFEYEHSHNGRKYRIEKIHYNNEERLPEAYEEAKVVTRACAEIIDAIIQKQPAVIENLIVDKEEVHIDLKAAVDKSKAVESLRSGLLNKVFWQRISAEFASYQNIFRKTKQFDFDFFFDNLSEVEVFMRFANRPPQGVIGNLILHKNDNGWQIKQFF